MSREDGLRLFVGFVVLVDSILGVLLGIGLDLSRPSGYVPEIGFVLSLPVFLLDLWADMKLPIFMLGLLLFRLTSVCWFGSVRLLLFPWRGNVLLILGILLLVLSKRKAPEQEL